VNRLDILIIPISERFHPDKLAPEKILQMPRHFRLSHLQSHGPSLPGAEKSHGSCLSQVKIIRQWDRRADRLLA
jgi:hypothetical protein